MYLNSRHTDAQPGTGGFSIIRTRSQKQNPLLPVNLSASPMKEAIRNHNYSHRLIVEHEKNKECHNAQPRNEMEDETAASSSHQKRPSSPSFKATDPTGKRIRVLAQSSRQNSLERRHSEESLSTPRKEPAHSPTDEDFALKRTMSYGSPAKGVIHLDLTKLPHSPTKVPGSPSKSFRITVDGRGVVQVPITPGRKIPDNFNGYGERKPGVHLGIPDNLNELHSIPPSPSNEIVPNQGEQHIFPSVLSQAMFTTVCIPHSDGDGPLCRRSPLKPQPVTPHADDNTVSSRSPFPSSKADEGLKSVESAALIPSLGQTSPTKSRIPVPIITSTSFLPHLSSASASNLNKVAPPDLTRSPRRHPIKQKTKINRKPKAEMRSRAPITRLAAKRGINRNSSSATGLRPRLQSPHGAKVPSSPHDAGLLDQANMASTASKVDRKGSSVTSSRLSTEHLFVQDVPSPHSRSTSPVKPTSLSALSTALKKLSTTPPVAPAHPPRPGTSVGFAAPSHVPAQTPIFQSQTMDPGMSLETPDKMQRLQTSLGHSRPLGTPKGLGRMGLPVRRPGTAAGVGAAAPVTGALFASKRTTLSTVPASPARSVGISSESNILSGQPVPNGVLDVDALAPRTLSDNGNGNTNDETVNQEYSVPLVDRLCARVEPQPEVSPSRRASQASISLTRSLSLPRGPSTTRPAIGRSASTSAASNYNPRTPVKTRGRTKPAVSSPEANTNAKQSDPMGGKRSNARMPGSLDVLKDCVIFVDVRTEEGEDAGALFIDMLRGLGARILAKPGKSCTHLVYKDGSPVTLTKYRLLPEPRPLPVSLGWVVECVEKRERVDETRFLVKLDEVGIAGNAQRRRSMQPKQMRAMTLGHLESGHPADISVRADSSFTSEEPSTSGVVLPTLDPSATSPNNDNLAPLERARQRSIHLSRGNS